jgi:menaquinone-dependent protoporphyrinogen oxidase
MNSPRVLIVYGTSYGQTEKIARHIADRLRADAFEVVLVDAKNDSAPARPGSFDGVIVGASIIARGHQPAIRDFVKANIVALNRMPSAFYSVCASAGSTFEKNREAGRKLRDVFLESVGWRPAVTASIAGAINFTRYGFLLRWYMKKASRMNGGSTDTSRDHEYTDWAQVDRFAADFASALRASRATEAVTP